MRIACIATSRVPSRTANSIQVMKVCQALATLGHEVRLFVPRLAEPQPWEALATHYGLRTCFQVIWLRAWGGLRRYDFSLRAVSAARRWGAELYYLWPYQAAALASSLGLPSLLEVHDLPTGRLGPWLFRRFLAGSGARRLLVTTDALRALLAERFGVTLEPPFLQIAPNGVDLERYANLPEPAEARRQLDLPEAFTAGYTGHLYPGRGLELMAELARRHPQFRFLWAGGEAQAVAAWRERLAAQGLQNVHLLGFVPNERLPLVQAACDVLLMPYARRIAVSGGGDTSAVASPMKAFEYLAAGRPVLSSDLPVFREVLSEDNALLLPPEDVEAWSAALQELAADPARRQLLARAAKGEAARYSWEERARRALEGVSALRS